MHSPSTSCIDFTMGDCNLFMQDKSMSGIDLCEYIVLDKEPVYRIYTHA